MEVAKIPSTRLLVENIELKTVLKVLSHVTARLLQSSFNLIKIVGQ